MTNNIDAYRKSLLNKALNKNCHRSHCLQYSYGTEKTIYLYIEFHAFWCRGHFEVGRCHLSNRVQKQKLGTPAKYSTEWQTKSLVHRKVPVSLTACGHCKLSHNQSSAATSLWTKKLSLPSPSGMSRESTACRLSQTVISEKGGKHIAWLTHHNLEGKWIPCLTPEERSDRKKKAERKEREG